MADLESSPLTGRDGERPRRPLLHQASSFASYQVLNIRQTNRCVSGRADFLILMVFICCAVMVVEIGQNEWTFQPMSENPSFGPTSQVLLELGAKRTDLILAGDWYRLFAPMVLHGGLIHLFANMVAMRAIGFSIEKQHGSVKTAYIFFVSGFTGVVVSAVFAPTAVGVGASGAIFGLLGATWSELFQNWSLYKSTSGPNAARKQLCSLAFSTALALVFGIMPYLDNFAHVGGLVAGFFTGLSVLVSQRYTRDGEKKDIKGYQLCLQIFALIITPASIVIGLMVLYLGTPGTEWCSWCSYISCVPIEGLWSCDDCSLAGVSATPIDAGTLSITCPVTMAIANVTVPDSSTITSSQLVALCKQECT